MRVSPKLDTFSGTLGPADVEALDRTLQTLFSDLKRLAAYLPYAPVTIEPPALTTHANNYEPTGLSGADTVRLKATSAVNLTGMRGTEGQRVLLVNVGTQTITLKANSTSSSPPNRFNFGADHALAAGNTATIYWDHAGPFWCPVSFGT